MMWLNTFKKNNPLDLIGFEINLKNLFNGAEQCSSHSTTSMNNNFKKKNERNKYLRPRGGP